MGWWDELVGNDDAEPDPADAAAEPSPEEEPSALEDILRSASSLMVPVLVDHPLDQLAESGGRLLDRARRGAPAAMEHPLETLQDFGTGAAQMTGIGSLVERLGTPREHTAQSTVEEALIPGLGLGRDLYGGGEAREAQRAEGFRQLHERQAAASERSPLAYAGGQIGGFLAPAAAPARAAQAEPVISPALQSLLEVGGYSGLVSEGNTPSEVLEDVGTGVASALPVVGGAHALGAAADRLTSQEARRVAHRAADRQRIASVRGESRGTISHRDFESLIQNLGRGEGGRDAQVSRAAQAVRDSGVVGPFSSAGEIADRTSRAERAAVEEMEGIRSEADANGASVPAEAVPRALERYAESLDPMGLGRWADVPRMEAETWRGGVTHGERGAEMRAHPAFDPGERLGALLEQRAALPTPPRIAELQRRLGASGAQEADLIARGEPGAVGREAVRERTRAGMTPDEQVAAARLEQARIDAAAEGRAPAPQAAPDASTRPGAGRSPREAPAPVEGDRAGSLSGVSGDDAAAREAEQEAFWRNLTDEDVQLSPQTDPGVGAGAEEAAGPYRSPDPRRSAAARDAHVRRAEADELVEHDLPEDLVPVWRSMGARRRAQVQPTQHASRAEVFEQWAHDHSADVQRMQIEAQEAGAGRMRPPPPDDLSLSRHTRDALPSAPTGTDEGLAGYTPDTEAVLQSIDEPSPPPAPVSFADLGPDAAADAHTAERDALWQAIQGRGLTIPRQRAEDALRILDRTTQWTTPSGQTVAPDVEVSRAMRHAARDAIDDSIAPFLSPERAAQYPAARRRYSHARTIGDVVRPAEERAAGRSSLASGLQAAAPIVASGGGAAPATAGAIAYRALRGRGATIDATFLEALARTLDAAPSAMARYRPILERARRAGTLGVAHRLLSRDPEYATEAERAIGSSAEAAPVEPEAPASAPAPPTDHEARRQAARRELARRELARRAAAREAGQ